MLKWCKVDNMQTNKDKILKLESWLADLSLRLIKF